MGIEKTHLLTDDPSSSDEFGTHENIAGLIRDEILQASEGRSIALVGDWGSGKSTIIELLKARLAGKENNNVHFFIYDAWAHQGDSLRRAFLDDLIVSMKVRLSAEEVASATDKVWNRTETTVTTKEPMLRRHAKVLLISLALIPMGMKLLDVPPDDDLGDLITGRNLFAFMFLLAPVLFVFVFGLLNWAGWNWAKTFLFGSSHNEKDFSVLSFFVEKVQGSSERKHIKTPADSIQAFRDVFSQMLDNAHSRNNDLRVIIVLDNIDRIPPEQARDFWSTMQTFFGDGGGFRKPRTKKYWLVAPFSVEALSFLFQDQMAKSSPEIIKADAKAKAKSYIDKTFGLAFYVPPPILTNWRKYLLVKLREAFPDNPHNELAAVRDIFDFSRSSNLITPREMKLFVNALVVLYRQRGEEISLPVMAIYVLQRDKISGMTIDKDLLSPRERYLIEESDWRIPIAALHFGVSLVQATQLLLQEPMLTALRDGSKLDLRELETRPGFADVLSHVLVIQLESPDAAKGGTLAGIAATIGALDSASKPELSRVWWTIRTRLNGLKRWDGLTTSTGEGISAVLSHISGEQKVALCMSLGRSLSEAQISDPESDMPHFEATYWLRAVLAIVESVGVTQAPKITLPGSMRTQIGILQQLALASIPDEIKRIFLLKITQEELIQGLALEIAATRSPRAPVALVKLLVVTLGLAVQWQPVLNACVERLRLADISAREVEDLILLILSASTIGADAAASVLLKNLSSKGYLSHLYYLHRKSLPTRARIVLAQILANPSAERPGQIEQSENGDVALSELLAKLPYEPDLLSQIAQDIKSLGADDIFFEVGSKTGSFSKLPATVIAVLTNSPELLNIRPELVVAEREFLEESADILPTTVFLQRLKTAGKLLELLENEPFQVARARFYRSALKVPHEGVKELAGFLAGGILDLEKEQWDNALNAATGPHFELLELAKELRVHNVGFALSVPAKDAALEQIRKVGNGDVGVSDEVRSRLAEIVSLLPVGLRSSLMRDVIDEMTGQSDAVNLTRRIEVIGDHLRLEEEVDADRIVRRIFGPALGHATERTATWIATVLAERLDFFRHMPKETADEFGWRLRTTLQSKDSLPEPVIASLHNIAGLLGIDLAQPDVS